MKAAIFALAVLLISAMTASIGSMNAPAHASGPYAFTVSPNASSIQPGGQVSVSGKVCPSPSPVFALTVVITYQVPNGTQVQHNGELGYGPGDYCSNFILIDSLTASTLGTWGVSAVASWTDGSQSYQVASNTATFTVQSTTTTTSTTTSSAASSTTSQTASSTTSSATSTKTSSQSSTMTGNSCSNEASANPAEVTIQQGCFSYLPLDVSSNSLGVYFSISDASIFTAMMTQQQFSDFQTSGDVVGAVGSYGTYEQGTQTYNALLLTPGTYYLVVDASQAQANVSFGYETSSDLAVQNSTTEVGIFLKVPAQTAFTLGVHQETTGSPSSLYLFGISNETIQYSLLDSVSGDTVLKSAPVTVTNLTQSASGFNLGFNVPLARSLYKIGVSNYNPSTAFVFLGYRITPQYVNPYLFRPSFDNALPNVPLAPTGIASYGLYNSTSGTVTTYDVEGSSVVGFADIRSLGANTPNLPSGFPADALSLQLNAIVHVRNSDGTAFTYWTQNVPQFYTSSKTGIGLDNVWNMTGDSAQLSNQTITSPNGEVLVSGGRGFYVNNVAAQQFRYNLPFAFLLYMNATAAPGTGVWIDMGVRILQNGSAVGLHSPTLWFDKILIADKNASSAVFSVYGDRYTPAGPSSNIGLMYDSELVFCGLASGAHATFTSLDAVLSLFYYNQTLRSYPSLYTFGVDTAEDVTNVNVALSPGYAIATLGSPDYSSRSNSFNSSLPALEAMLGGGSGTSTGSSTSSSSTTGHSLSGSATTSMGTSSSTGASAGSSPPQPPNPMLIYIAGAVVAIVIFAGGTVFVLKRKR